MNWESLVPIATFLTIALGIWGILTAIAERQARAEDRLERMLKGSMERRSSNASLTRKQDRIQQLVAKTAPALAKSLKVKEEDLGRIRLDLMNAGFRGEQSVQVYLALKFVLTLIALVAAIPLVYARMGFDKSGLMVLLVAAAIGYYLPSLVLRVLKNKRMEAIFLGLPDALDLMVVCVEAGLGLDAAMRRVANELAENSPELCEELAICNFQVQMGRPRKDVLHDFGRRTGVSDVRALAAILIQAERFGSSIATALRVQSDSMRVRRKQLAEERGAKTAVKIMIPLILFIFPGIFVVLVGPAGITIAETLLGK